LNPSKHAWVTGQEFNPLFKELVMKSVTLLSAFSAAFLSAGAISHLAYAQPLQQSSNVVKSSAELQVGPAFLQYDPSNNDPRFETLYLTYKGYLTKNAQPVTVAGSIDDEPIEPYLITESRSGFSTGFRKSFAPGIHSVELYFYDAQGRFDSNYSQNYKGTFEIKILEND
jgi:hypothetical protein